MTTLTVHCFFSCPFVAQGPDPAANHAEMEKHYNTAHAAEIAVWTGKP